MEGGAGSRNNGEDDVAVEDMPRGERRREEVRRRGGGEVSDF